MTFLDTVGLSYLLAKIQDTFATNKTFDSSSDGLVPSPGESIEDDSFLKANGVWEVINDYTTGINLLRGTRDFSIKEDCFWYDELSSKIAFTITKDSDEFSVLNTSMERDHLNSSKAKGFSIGESVTFSCDVKVDDTKPWEDNKEEDYVPPSIFSINIVNEENEIVKSIPLKWLDLDLAEVGEWARLEYSFVVSDRDDAFEEEIEVLSEYDMVDLYISFFSNEDTPIHFCRPKLEHGIINNSVWSASPFDSYENVGGASLPLSIDNGGTGANTQETAWRSLGGGDVGKIDKPIEGLFGNQFLNGDGLWVDITKPIDMVELGDGVFGIFSNSTTSDETSDEESAAHIEVRYTVNLGEAVRYSTEDGNNPITMPSDYLVWTMYIDDNPRGFLIPLSSSIYYGQDSVIAKPYSLIPCSVLIDEKPYTENIYAIIQIDANNGLELNKSQGLEHDDVASFNEAMEYLGVD